MKLNKEQHAKVFGLYIGSMVIYPDGEIVTIVGITPYEGMIQVLKSNDNVDWWNYHNAKLILTTLSEITDEDCFYIANLKYQYKEGYDLDLAIKMGKILAEIIGGNYSLKWSFGREIMEIIDYLRSKSYHIPYMGYDLYESGIAIKPKEVK